MARDSAGAVPQRQYKRTPQPSLSPKGRGKAALPLPLPLAGEGLLVLPQRRDWRVVDDRACRQRAAQAHDRDAEPQANCPDPEIDRILEVEESCREKVAGNGR